LQQLIADGNTPQKIVKRARIILMTADRHGVMAIMREVGVSKTTVWRWKEYFAEAGVEGLVKGLRMHKKKHYRGWGKRRMKYSASEKLEIIRLVEQSDLPVHRTLEKLGASRATFYRWYELCQTGGLLSG
jgi:transposase-like protein